MVIFPSANAWSERPCCFNSVRVARENSMVGNFCTSNQSSPCMCSCKTELSTRKLEASKKIVPLVSAGFSGSKETLPETPPADPLIDSRSASSWKITVFTPLGSLKSKAFAPPKRSTGKKKKKNLKCFISLFH